MKIIFLGGLFPSFLEENILKHSKGAVQYAANNFQKNIIKGFSENGLSGIDIVSAPFIGSYPKNYTEFYIKENKKIIEYNNMFKSISFINLWGVRNYFRRKNLEKYLKTVEINLNELNLIVIYSLHTPLLIAASTFKKKYPNTKILCIVPDLPEFMRISDNKSRLYSFLKKIDNIFLEKELSCIDSFVLLTEQMNAKINKRNKPYTIVEGIISRDITMKQNEKIIETNKYFTIVYTGTLSEKYGVLNLIQAFLKLDHRMMRLQICGKGDAEDKVIEFSEKYENINYLGQISNEESLKLQFRADILVNPRQNQGEYTKYSFPSKNLEYLLSGNPLIAYKLSGIPDEYDEYIYYVKDNSIDSLSQLIYELYKQEKEKRVQFGEKAQKFVLEKKNSKNVVKNILINLGLDLS